MNRERRRIYNAMKQREYRRIRGLKHSEEWILKRNIKTEDILKSNGHCGFCGMLLNSDYHKGHPLQGCMRYMG